MHVAQDRENPSHLVCSGNKKVCLVASAGLSATPLTLSTITSTKSGSRTRNWDCLRSRSQAGLEASSLR